MKTSALFVLSLSCASAIAATPVVLETPVTYAPGASVVEQIKSECHIEDMLALRVGDVLRKRNRGGPGTIEASADANGVQVLRLQVTHVLGVGGGAWTGPKAITVTADLLDGGKVVRHTKVSRWSVGGVWGAFKGSCSILDRDAIIIAKDMARWVRDPSYVVKEDAPPQEAAASAPTAVEGAGAAPAVAPVPAAAE